MKVRFNQIEPIKIRKPKQPKYTLTPDQERDIHELNEKITAKQLGEKLGFTKNQIIGILRRFNLEGYQSNKGARKGEGRNSDLLCLAPIFPTYITDTTYSCCPITGINYKKIH